MTPAAKRRKASNTGKMGESVTKAGQEKYVLKLYITGMTQRSQAALRNLEKICDEYLAGNYTLEVIDIYQQPTLAKGDQIIAVPTLIKKLPLPLRRMIGDLSEEDKIVLGLDLKARKKQPDSQTSTNK